MFLGIWGAPVTFTQIIYSFSSLELHFREVPTLYNQMGFLWMFHWRPISRQGPVLWLVLSGPQGGAETGHVFGVKPYEPMSLWADDNLMVVEWD